MVHIMHSLRILTKPPIYLNFFLTCLSNSFVKFAPENGFGTIFDALYNSQRPDGVIIYQRRNLMKNNMGSMDRSLRAIFGIIAIALGFYFQSWWGAIGLILLITATISWCPLYVPFKLTTRKSENI